VKALLKEKITKAMKEVNNEERWKHLPFDDGEESNIE
jgi:hypothetical protein